MEVTFYVMHPPEKNPADALGREGGEGDDINEEQDHGGGRGGRGFLDSKRVRQGCPLYPLLFKLLIANMEGEMEKVRWGGIEFGGRKEYSYVDDVVLLAEEEDEMKSTIKRLEGYLEKKRFKLNLKKTKVTRKGRGWIGKRE